MPKKVIPYGRHWIDDDDIRAVVKALRSGWISRGPASEKFEKAMAAKLGAKYALSCSSGTAALHLAVLAAGFCPGDKVLVPPITFLSSANVVLLAGADVEFVDICPDDFNIDPDLAEAACARDGKIKGIIPVHFAGHPCDMGRLSAIAKKHKLTVIEDAAHALGSSYKVRGRTYRVGSSAHSAMTALSFHPVKHITTGEGGMLLTRRRALLEKLPVLRFHGITRDRKKFINKNLPLWNLEMQNLGLNYFLTDFQCALGLSQLRKLDFFVRRRREIAAMYDRQLAGVDEIITPLEKKGCRHSYHLYVIRVRRARFFGVRDKLYEELHRRGIMVQLHYPPVYRQPFYRKRYDVKPFDFPQAEAYYRTALTLPIFPAMTDADVGRVISEVKRALKKKGK